MDGLYKRMVLLWVRAFRETSPSRILFPRFAKPLKGGKASALARFERHCIAIPLTSRQGARMVAGLSKQRRYSA